MVEEAQQLRARVLSDLSRRRKTLHSQIEQLRAGRERLAETITDVRRSVDTIADDLFAAEDEARRAAEAAARELANRPEEEVPDDLAGMPPTAADEPPREVPAGEAVEGEAVEGETGEAPAAPAVAEESVDELFARLRAAQSAPFAGPDRVETGQSDPAGPGGPAGQSEPGGQSEPATAEAGGEESADGAGEGPPAAGRPEASAARRTGLADRDRSRPTPQADAPGQPERAARHAPFEGLSVVGRPAPRSHRARRRVRDRHPPRARRGCGGGGRLRRTWRIATAADRRDRPHRRRAGSFGGRPAATPVDRGRRIGRGGRAGGRRARRLRLPRVEGRARRADRRGRCRGRLLGRLDRGRRAHQTRDRSSGSRFPDRATPRAPTAKTTASAAPNARASRSRPATGIRPHIPGVDAC